MGLKAKDSTPERPSFENRTQHRDSFSLIFQKEKAGHRYEVHSLIPVLKILEDTKLWPIHSRKGEKWDRFWREFTEFAQPNNYKRWNIQYNQFQLNRSGLDAYKTTLYQGILHLAAKSGLPMIVEYLLEKRLASVDEEDGNGSTALSVSAFDPELWNTFLKHGADISKKNHATDQTIWEKAWAHLYQVCDSGDALIVKSAEDCCYLLISGEADINRDLGIAFNNASALHLATSAGSWRLFDALMKHPQIDAKVKDNLGNNALHWVFLWSTRSSEGVREKMVSALIEAGVDPNAENSSSATPLPAAISHQAEGSVRLLLEGGANPKDETDGGFSALHWAAARKIDIEDNPDHEKALRIFKLILSHDQDFERETTDGTTPFEMALQSWNWGFVKAIIMEYEKKYDTDLKYLVRRDSYNRNFLHHCSFNIRWGSDIVKNIIPLIPKEDLDRLLADRSTFIGRPSGGTPAGLPGVSRKKKNSGGTPLLDAFQEGRADLAEIYLKAGADITTKSTVCLNCFEEAVIGLYRAKSQTASAWEEFGLETQQDRVKRYEAYCHLILDSSKEPVQSSSPTVLHYLVAKGELDLIKRVMECSIDYAYTDIEGWTVVEWAHAFKQQEALELVAKISKALNGGVEINRRLRQTRNPTKLVCQRRQTSPKSLEVQLSDNCLSFQLSGGEDGPFRDVQSVVFDNPVPPIAGISYFEVEFWKANLELLA